MNSRAGAIIPIFCFIVLFLPQKASTQRSEPQPIKQIDKFQKVSITVEEDYGSLQPTESRVSKWIYGDLKEILTALDFTIAKQEEPSEISIRIKITGVPIDAAYNNVGTLYPGAEISGEIILAFSGIIKRRDFSGKCHPPSPLFVYGDEYKKPSDAPFHRAYRYSNFMFVMAEEIEALLEIPRGKFLITALQVTPYKENIVDELAKIGMPAVPYLAEILKNKDQEIKLRVNAAVALGKTRLNAFKVLDPLNEALDDKSEYLRKSAALAIAEISEEERGLDEAETRKAVLVLIPALTKSEDIHAYDRQVAISALGELRNELAVEPLISTLKNAQGNIYLQSLTSEALKKITGQNLGTDSQRWLEWWEQKREALPERN